jgi:hypothetical protein
MDAIRRKLWELEQAQGGMKNKSVAKSGRTWPRPASARRPALLSLVLTLVPDTKPKSPPFEEIWKSPEAVILPWAAIRPLLPLRLGTARAITSAESWPAAPLRAARDSPRFLRRPRNLRAFQANSAVKGRLDRLRAFHNRRHLVVETFLSRLQLTVSNHPRVYSHEKRRGSPHE